MLLVKTKEIEPGMILQKDVVDNSGRLIISAGTLLNAKHLRIMMIWGIGEAYILKEKQFKASNHASSINEKEHEKQPVLTYKKNNNSSETGNKIFMFNDMQYPFIGELFKVFLSIQCKVK